MKYSKPHDLAIRAANWAMKEDPQCVLAHQCRMAAKEELELATRHEVPKARAAFEAANAEWRRITTEVFDRVMAAAGFPQDEGGFSTSGKKDCGGRGNRARKSAPFARSRRGGPGRP